LIFSEIVIFEASTLVIGFSGGLVRAISVLIRSGAGSRRVSFGDGRLRKHHLVAGFARPGIIAAQARDDLADVGNVAAARPKHIGTTGVLLRPGALREGRAAENDQCRANDLA
jgi:hypothetical protein